MKVCKVCGTGFEGRRCNECHKRISREYVAKNKELVKQKAAAYRKANADKIREYQAVRRLLDGEKIAADKARYSSENSAKVVARVNRWRKANPEGKRIQSHNYRARKNGRGRLSPGLASRLYDEQNGKCACCWRSLESGYQMDHVVPLSRGGANIDSNIQLLTPLCNQRKHALSQSDYEARYGAENGYGLV